MTRTALAAPDDNGPDDPNPDAWAEALARAHWTVISWTDKCADKMPEIRFRADLEQTIGASDFAICHSTGDKSLDRIIQSPFLTQAMKRDLLARHAKRPWYARVSPHRLAGLAVFIAGHQRAELGCEWRAHLSGETGGGLPEGRQLRDATGFIVAAIRCRLQDAADSAWRPVDAALASRAWSNLFVLFTTLTIVVIHICHGGLYEVADNLEGVAVVWGAAFGLIHVGRQWRDVKPHEHKPRKNKP